MRTIEQIFASKNIVPTISLTNIQQVLAVTEALVAGGASAISIRVVDKNSLTIIRELRQQFPQLCIGAARILDAADFLNVSLAGAEYIVSPGSSPEIYTAARTRYNSAHFIPGVISPSDVMRGLSENYTVMNLYPVGAMDGLALAKAYAIAFPEVKFVLSGGMRLDNAAEYLKLNNVLAVGVPDISSNDLVASGNLNEISARMQQANAISATVVAANSRQN